MQENAAHDFSSECVLSFNLDCIFQGEQIWFKLI